MNHNDSLAYQHQKGLYILAQGHILCFLQALLTHITLILIVSDLDKLYIKLIYKDRSFQLCKHQFLNVQHIFTTFIESIPKTWLETDFVVEKYKMT